MGSTIGLGLMSGMGGKLTLERLSLYAEHGRQTAQHCERRLIRPGDVRGHDQVGLKPSDSCRRAGL